MYVCRICVCVVSVYTLAIPHLLLAMGGVWPHNMSVQMEQTQISVMKMHLLKSLVTQIRVMQHA